jgi:Family of unknown function (DUF6496)
MISFIGEKTVKLKAFAADLLTKVRVAHGVKQPHLRLVTMATKSKSRKYGQKASSKVGRAMHEMKRGKLKSGKSGKKVKSRKQAIAIGLSEARKSGAKVPSR